eukprot:TRINITY_DN12714_c0_g1_i1.p1 TRINITY_DN12714_c0_g1~~TRINITY_DN12714_c0_g1_i1.p1  ORF type:complete len:729 (-),score=133.49 TRINITY_DN12714_c0_g1_i1:24-2210(-)
MSRSNGEAKHSSYNSSEVCSVVALDPTTLRKLRKSIAGKSRPPLLRDEEIHDAEDGATIITKALSTLLSTSSEFRTRQQADLYLLLHFPPPGNSLRFNLSSEVAPVPAHSYLALNVRVNVQPLLINDSVLLPRLSVKSDNSNGAVPPPLEAWEVLGGTGKKTKVPLKKLRRILFRSFRLLHQKKHALLTAIASTLPLPYHSSLIAHNSIDLPLLDVVLYNNPSSVTDTSSTTSLNTSNGGGTLAASSTELWPELFIASENVEHEYKLSGVERAPEDLFYGRSVSTYPPSPSTDLICDSYFAVAYKNLYQLVIADGCNWGLYPALAASNAVKGFIEHCREHFALCNETETTHALASLLLRAVHSAHQQILMGHQQYLDQNPSVEPETPAGTTTLLGGVVIPTVPRDPTDPPYVGLFVSLGDCKCYRLSKKTGLLLDITRGLRPEGLQRSDPGGRLGPYDSGQSDTRNLKLLSVGLEIGDSLILMSDGVHDNFDPQQLGYDSQTFGYPAWTDVPNSEKLDYLKTEIAQNKFFGGSLETPLTPRDIVNTLIDHCLDVTSAARKFMTDNPNQRQPRDYKMCPGKMDHTTCLVFTLPDTADLPPFEHTQTQHSPTPDKDSPNYNYKDQTSEKSPRNTQTTSTGGRLPKAKAGSWVSCSSPTNTERHLTPTPVRFCGPNTTNSTNAIAQNRSRATTSHVNSPSSPLSSKSRRFTDKDCCVVLEPPDEKDEKDKT